MTWIQLVLVTHATHTECISDLLTEYGACSISLEDAGDETLFQMFPHDTPCWNEVKITALFCKTHSDTALAPEKSVEKAVERCVCFLKTILAPERLEYSVEEIPEQDWVRQTQENFPPRLFGDHLWVLPSWCDRNDYAGKIVTIDPGLAFGTGTHPTTALCLEWLAQYASMDVINVNIIDYGCGSGILSLAALALGAQFVFAVDHDPQALEATANNAKHNPTLAARLCTALPTEQSEKIKKKCGLLIANLLAEPLFSLMDTFKALTSDHATLILSGILSTEVPPIIQAYGSFCHVTSVENREGWARVVLMRK